MIPFIVVRSTSFLWNQGKPSILSILSIFTPSMQIFCISDTKPAISSWPERFLVLNFPLLDDPIGHG